MQYSVRIEAEVEARIIEMLNQAKCQWLRESSKLVQHKRTVEWGLLIPELSANSLDTTFDYDEEKCWFGQRVALYSVFRKRWTYLHTNGIVVENEMYGLSRRITVWNMNYVPTYSKKISVCFKDSTGHNKIWSHTKSNEIENAIMNGDMPDICRKLRIRKSA